VAACGQQCIQHSQSIQSDGSMELVQSLALHDRVVSTERIPERNEFNRRLEYGTVEVRYNVGTAGRGEDLDSF